jgi:NADH-quinone oxidoreductase subunit J
VVILYAGAIMVVVLFVIMMFQRSPREVGLVPQWGHATLLGAVFLAVAIATVFKDPSSRIVLQGAVAQPKDFGGFLFDRYWLAVEIISVLLLVALVTIIQLAKRKERSGDEAERHINPVRNSGGAVNPVGVVSKSTLSVEPRGIVSNGGKEDHS